MDPELLEKHVASSSGSAAMLIVAGWSSFHHVFTWLLICFTDIKPAFQLVDNEHIVSSFISRIEFLQARVLSENVISNSSLLTLIKSAGTRNGIYCVWLKYYEVLHFFPLMNNSLSFVPGCYSKPFTRIN